MVAAIPYPFTMLIVVAYFTYTVVNAGESERVQDAYFQSLWEHIRKTEVMAGI
jgi:hypothetical protein